MKLKNAVKFLVKSAVVVGAVGGIVYLVKDKMDKRAMEYDFDDDFDDDFEDDIDDTDMEEDLTCEREYVDIPNGKEDDEASLDSQKSKE